MPSNLNLAAGSYRGNEDEAASDIDVSLKTHEIIAASSCYDEAVSLYPRPAEDEKVLVRKTES